MGEGESSLSIIGCDLILRGVGHFACLKFLLREERLENFGGKELVQLSNLPAPV
jgi:hypothetical protein